MASALLLDPEDFLPPIPGDNPAGTPLGIADRNKLVEYQEDFDPERDLSEEERRSPQFAESKRKSPKWNDIIDFGTKYLKDKGKDLEVAVRMIEAMTKKTNGGFAGTKTGFRLVRRLCEECWDRMTPVIEDPSNPEDMEFRTSKLNWLDDTEKKPYFPTTIRALPVIVAGGVTISFLATQQQGNRPAQVSQDEFRATVAQAKQDDVAKVQAMDEDITETIRELQELSTILDGKAGRQAPGFGAIRKALDDCQTMTRQILRLRGGAEGGEGASGSSAMDSPGGGGVGSVRNREDIYAQLNRLIDMLESTDPHSPVPLLIRRAIEMRGMKFPELVDALTKDARVLDFMRNTPPAASTPPG